MAKKRNAKKKRKPFGQQKRMNKRHKKKVKSSRKRIPKPVIIRETFVLPSAKHAGYREQSFAKPKEPFSLHHEKPAAFHDEIAAHKAARFQAHHHLPSKTKMPVPSHIAAIIASLAATALVAVFLIIVLGLGLLYATAISAAVFVGCSIVFHSALDSSQ